MGEEDELTFAAAGTASAVDSEKRAVAGDLRLLTQGGPPKHRYAALDSLRGFASLSVMVMHFSMLAPLLWLRHTPLRILLAGHEAVILFFVLSGYVLTLQIYSAAYSYPGYLVKRVCRIYLPYIATLAVALLLADILPARILGLGHFFSSTWPNGISAHEIIAHILLIGPFDSRRINGVVWSLIYEMRISLILPLVVLAIVRLGIWRVLVVTFVGSISVAIIMAQSNQQLLPSSFDGSWLATVHYLFIFTCGAVLSLSRKTLLNRLTPGVSALLFLGSLVTYFAAQKLSSIHHLPIGGFIWDWLIAAAVCGIIQCLITANPISQLFERKPFVFLGRISYSLYLYHLVIMHATVYALFGKLPLSIVLAISAILSLVVAYVSFVLIEQPATRLGYILEKRIILRIALA